MMHIRTIGEIKAYSKNYYLIYPILYNLYYYYWDLITEF